MTVARVLSPRPLSQLALIRSRETVEQAVKVMLDKVDTEAEISSTVKAQDADFLLAEQDGTPMGFALVTYAGWTPAYSCVLPHRYARLEDLVVGKAYRGRGIGGELLAAAKRWARNRRLEYVELQVLAQNEGAQHLYESQDFVEATKVMRCML